MQSDETKKTVLSLNVGSSSMKAAVFGVQGDDVVEHRRLSIERDDASTVALLSRVVDDLDIDTMDVVGHRVVHGGLCHEPARVDDELLEDLRGLFSFAPLHLPPAVEMIEAARRRWPGTDHVACFDTAFHRSMPEIAQRFALPKSLWDEGIRRFGFHGLSYEHVVHQIGPARLGRAVVAHLGNGVSLCAIQEGRSIDTTMGFTPTAGVVMGTRSGDLDPGLLVYLQQERGFDAERLNHLVNHEAGLLGLSGTTSDMRMLLERRETDSNATLAIDAFCYSVRKQIGAYAAVLGGLDTLVFTGGIGEHAPTIRSQIVDGVDLLRGVEVLVVPTNEEGVIARHAASLAPSKR